jgi:hypothetical protein
MAAVVSCSDSQGMPVSRVPVGIRILHINHKDNNTANHIHNHITKDTYVLILVVTPHKRYPTFKQGAHLPPTSGTQFNAPVIIRVARVLRAPAHHAGVKVKQSRMKKKQSGGGEDGAELKRALTAAARRLRG